MVPKVDELLMNTATGQLIDLAKALRQGLISTNVTSLRFFDAVDNDIYQPETDNFCNPFTVVQETLKQALVSGLIDGSSARVRSSSAAFVTLHEAARMGLLDEHRLDAAIEQKVIVPLHKAWSLYKKL